MSFTAEPEAKTKTNARSSLINWLRGFSGSVPEHASARELAKGARSFGRGDPMVEEALTLANSGRCCQRACPRCGRCRRCRWCDG
jgi:hypothetical protein